MSAHDMLRAMVARTQHTYSVLGAPIDALSWDDALGQIHDWAGLHLSRYVCICNVHSIVTARQNQTFSQVLADADMATPDGAPIAWLLRRFGAGTQQRINGPDLMWRYCEQAAQRGESIFLYGGSDRTLALLRLKLIAEFPGLHIAGCYAPPFRPLTPEEDAAVVERINASGAGTVWVSLGCPKQEQWMAAHRGRIQAVMIGVGAAFDYHAGTLQRAPLWMQRRGLEWLYRLGMEPRRLWRRYVFTNTHFVLAVIVQLAVGRPVEATVRQSRLPASADSMAQPAAGLQILAQQAAAPAAQQS